VAGRTDEALDDLVGFFVNTLVLRTDLSGDPSFAQLLDQARDLVLAAQAHQDVPFERLVEALNPVRSPAQHPLFQVMLADQDTGTATWHLPGLAVQDEPVPAMAAKFDLTLAFAQDHDSSGTPAGIGAFVGYPPELFDDDTIEALAARLTGLLRDAAASPDRQVSTLDVLTATERRALAEWNATDRQVPEATLPDLFEAQANRTPDAVALVSEGRELSYTELNERANRLARHLIGLGAGPEQLVTIAMPRTPDMITAVFAVLKTGAAYVPVDPGYPADRIAYMLADTSPVTVLTTAQAGQCLPDGTPKVTLDAPATIAELAGLDSGNLDLAALRPSTPAYVIYTSGSTGRPKGVVIEHRNVTNMLAWAGAEFSPDELSRVLAATSLTFDVSVFEIFAPLVTGGSIEIVADLLALADSGGESWHGSLISAVPSALSDVLSVHAGTAHAETVVVAGETLTAHAVTSIRATLPGARIRNLYGPTETTVYCTAARADQADSSPPPIGRPFWNTQAYVLDDNLRPVPPGVTAELYLAGAQLARGYLNRRGLTAERFTASPYGPPGQRMYRSGDLARWTTTGDLEFQGRVDDQVKVRGFRIELGEIEAVLGGLAGIAQAAVTVREDRPGDKRLAGYVVPATGTVLDPSELRDACVRALPGYMIPAIVVLDRLPLTANGKLDRRALPAPDYAAGAEAFLAPATATERELCELFAQVLGLDRVGVDDSFFDLGGHSLLAAVLVARLTKQTGANLSLKAFMGNPTVRAIDRHLAP